MYLLLQLCLLFVISVVLTSFASTKKIAIILSVLFGVFFSSQIASLLFGGSLIDYKFYVHLHFDVSHVKDFFLTQILMIITSIGVSTFLIYFCSRKWRMYKILNGRVNYYIIPFCLILFSLDGGVINNIYRIVRLNLTAEKAFFSALKDLGINPIEYTLPENVQAVSGKNIIVISIESYEKGFLSDHLAHLSPNLRKMAKEMTFYDVMPAPGSEWTAGSIYTEICGFPSFFKNHGNEIFQNAYGTKITGLGHILNAAGYDLTYMLGGHEFAGVGDMLRTHKFSVKSDADLSEKYEGTGWGVHDKDLFHEAKKELLAKKKVGKPFALFMSTLSTHHPDGIYDARMEGLVSTQKSNLEFMAAATDHLIGDLFEFLKKEDMLSNTAIFLFPDHLLMGKTARVLSDLPLPRGLYVITNVPEEKLSYSTKEAQLQIDIPKMILQGAEVKHNVKFLTDFLSGKDKLEFIKQNESNLVALNEASLNTESFRNGFKIELTENNSLCIKSTNYSDTLKNISSSVLLHELSFDNNMRIISKQVIESLGKDQQKNDNLKLVITIKNNKIYAYLNKGNLLGIAKQGDKEISFSKDDIQIFSDWSIGEKVKTQQEYITPYKSGQPIYLTSTGYDPDLKYSKSEIRIGDKSYPITRGVNLLIKEGGEFKVENYDTYENIEQTRNFIHRLNDLKNSKTFYAMVVHDSGEKELKKYRKELDKLGFNQLNNLNFREAYIGYSYKGIISEHKHPHSISFSFPQIFQESLRSDAQIEKDRKDVKKFIAHGGGVIDGYTYTNSLEALNLSYEKGFKMFELDIIKTSDGKYVCAHDWDNWALQTGYKGQLPPTHSEFLKHKIRGKFTPIDMETINKWFLSHKDAILVTDKINEPRDFSNQFVDKGRLSMELFSMDAVKEGLTLGLRAVLMSENVLDQIKEDKIGKLKELGIKHLVMSRNRIEGNIDFFLKLKENGIKVYAFHVNFEKGKDEVYMVIHEMDYIYGIYADDWEF